jgi:hypothetical protein
MEFVVVELNATEYAEVVGAEFIGGTDLGSVYGRRMERGRDGRCESGRGGMWRGRGRRRQSSSREPRARR